MQASRLAGRQLSTRTARLASAQAITVANGDGIGPEIMDATIKILDAAKAKLDYEYIDIGLDVYKRGLWTTARGICTPVLHSPLPAFILVTKRREQRH